MGFARSLLTSRPNNACDSTRYAEISRTERRDVWHGAARTNDPYIRRIRAVNCRPPPPMSRPVRRNLAAHLWIERLEITTVTVAAINMWFYTRDITYLLIFGTDVLEQILFLRWEIFYHRKNILYICNRKYLNFRYEWFDILEVSRGTFDIYF